MNIFVLDTDPAKCAQDHCDKHLIKMIVEHNQILGSISHMWRGISKRAEITPEYVCENFKGFPRLNESGEPHPYGIGYKNHPCTQWASKSLGNYRWLCVLNAEMCKEYTRRYGKKHAGEDITRWYASNHPELPMLGVTPFALAMPESLKTEDPVHSYRLYYASHKVYFAKWKNGGPTWWKQYLQIVKENNLFSEKCAPFFQ
jgi:hypothetical protein